MNDDLRALAQEAMEEMAEAVRIPDRQPGDFTAAEFAPLSGCQTSQGAMYQLKKLVRQKKLQTELRRDP